MITKKRRGEEECSEEASKGARKEQDKGSIVNRTNIYSNGEQEMKISGEKEAVELPRSYDRLAI